MKNPFLVYLYFILIISTGTSFCDKMHSANGRKNINDMTAVRIKITVNDQSFRATLFDNTSAKAFTQLLPMTIKMNELNGNEKYCDIPSSLPTNSDNPKTIKSGDLMLYGSTTIVLFYKTFPTSYSYSKLGQMDDAGGLAYSLGSHDTMVTFELDRSVKSN